MEERQLGSIVHYNGKKAVGFISGADDIAHFFHVKFVRPTLSGGRPIPKAGDLFYFSIRPSTHKVGCDEAFDLEFVRRAKVGA